jgi:hypothetical protein
MKRVCIEIASDWYKPQTDVWLTTPTDARKYFRGKSFRFDGATAYIYTQRRYIDFTDVSKLFKCLASTDEIITFNGRICDLIVLESLVGKEAAGILWQKPHHDLQGWQGCQSLKGAITHLLPKLVPYFDSVLDAQSQDKRKVWNFHCRKTR